MHSGRDGSLVAEWALSGLQGELRKTVPRARAPAGLLIEGLKENDATGD